MVAWAGALLTGNTKETGDIVLRPVQVCLLIAYYKYINIFLFNQEALLITEIYRFQNALRIPKQILDLLHQKEMGRQELACFPLNMMVPQRINVSLNRTMVAWGGALWTRSMTEDGAIARQINVRVCFSNLVTCSY